MASSEGTGEHPPRGQASRAVHIGTSRWQHDDWRGGFYPEDLPQRKRLESSIYFNNDRTGADEGPDGVDAGDYVAISIKGAGAWEPDATWTPASTEPFWSPDHDAAVRATSVSFAYRRRLGENEGSITVFVPRSAA